MEKHPPAYLSPSRLSTYQWCPAEFHRRYVLKIHDPSTPEQLFGVAVHKGLEAHYRGEDAELGFLRVWRAAKQSLTDAQQPLISGLDQRGLEILDMVRALGLQGEPERFISVTHPSFIIPFIGYVDLWDESSKTIYDFKTAAYGWTQKKADEQVFQPAIYSQAVADAFGLIPTFKFVVAPRGFGPVQVFDGTRTGDQILAAFDQALEIHEAIEAKEFPCRCGKHEDAAA